MKILLRTLFLFLVVVLITACDDNDPKTHSSIVGTWRCEEYTPSGTRTYLVDIDRRISDTTQYVVSNFYNTGDVEFVILKLKSNKLTLAENATSNITVSALSGTVIDLTQIILNYKIYDGKTNISVEAVYSRN